MFPRFEVDRSWTDAQGSAHRGYLPACRGKSMTPLRQQRDSALFPSVFTATIKLGSPMKARERSSSVESGTSSALLASVARSPQVSTSTSANHNLIHNLSGLENILQGLLVQARSRPSRRKESGGISDNGACDGCRKAKTKCDGSTEKRVCTRCKSTDIECKYSNFNKRGRKNGPMSTVTLLEDAIDKVNSSLRIAAFTGADSTAQDTDHHPPDMEEMGGQNTLMYLENPLQVLAQVSTSAEHHDLSNVASKEPQYFGTDLSPTVADTDLAFDPIFLNILTEDDFERLLRLYFKHLRPVFWMLDEQIHSSAYIRTKSPFLATALAAATALFCPESGHLLQPLWDHAVHLATRVQSGGYKSLEIVQGFCFLMHWASPAESWSRDRAWGWLGMATRIATEIRMDRRLPWTDDQAHLTEDIIQMLDTDCRRTWHAIYCGEISMSVQTGRTASLNGYTRTRGVPNPPVDSPDRRESNIHATVFLRRVLAQGLEKVPTGPKSDRSAFNQVWKTKLEVWSNVFREPAHFVRIIYYNTQITLLLFSLRYPGPSLPVLQECKMLAMTVASMVANWPDDSFQYASNFMAVAAGYGGTLLLRLMSLERGLGDTLTEKEILALVTAVSGRLVLMGTAQPHGPSLASHLGQRLKQLVDRARSLRQHSAWQSRVQSRAGSPEPSSEHPDLDAAAASLFASFDANPEWPQMDTQLGYDFKQLFEFNQYLGGEAEQDNFDTIAGGWIDNSAF